MSIPIGTTVRTSSGLIGVLRYEGEINVAQGVWCGIELSDATGKNDGSVKGKRYFQCPPLHGVFAKRDAVKPVPQAASPTKPVTTKRQSIIESNSPRRPPQASDAAKDAQIEELKAKIRAMEKKRLEDRENSKKIAQLEAQVDETSQTLIELRSQLQEEQERPAHLESQLELATLDKEMAEDRAESLERELNELRNKHEVLSLEYDILKEENSELSRNMSEEEKADSGWLHLERERDRLREALVLLRDHKQEVESELRQEIGNLQTNLDETEEAASKYMETADLLHRMEETNVHLREQLEAAESQEELIAVMMQERDRQLEQIEGLKSYLGELEELIQTNEDIEKFYAETEKGLLLRLDEQEAVLHERERKTTEQERTIEDLEYTLNKFRIVVQGLQSDIDEARRTREISELQAHEMNTKARAMVDLNMRLQSNAAKSQSKAIEVEMVKAQAVLSSRHVEILTTFVPDNFDSERTPIMAFLAFSRLKTKASLVNQMLLEKVSDRTSIGDGQNVLDSYQVVTHMQKMQTMTEDIVTFMTSCSPEQFHAFSNASQELEPVDRTITNWLEAVKNDQLGADDPGNTKRIRAILQDMYEKLVPTSLDTKASELVSITRNMQSHFNSVGHLVSWLRKLAELRLGTPDEDDMEAGSFDQKTDQLIKIARTNQYVCSKIAKELEHVKAKRKCLHETTWPAFEQAERNADGLRDEIHRLCYLSLQFMDDPESAAQLSYSTFLAYLDSHPEDLKFADIFHKLTSFQNSLEQLSSMSVNLSTSHTFTLNPPPWTVRAKELKTQRQMSAELQDELTNLQRRNGELTARIADRERAMEEVNIRAELAEKRAKDNKVRDAANKAHKEELDKVKVAKEIIEQEFQSLRLELLNLKEQSAQDKEEIATLTELQKAATTDPSSINGIAGGPRLALLDGRVKSLLADIENLEATIRHLSWENTQLTIPISEVKFRAAQTWLEPLKNKRTGRARNRQQDNTSIWRLLDSAAELKPLRLKT